MFEKVKEMMADRREASEAKDVANTLAETGGVVATVEAMGHRSPEKVYEAIMGKIDRLDATGTKSKEQLKNITQLIEKHPDYFGGDEAMTAAFRTRLEEKSQDLKEAPELLEKKENFWKKWKTGSMLAGGASVLGMVGGAAYSAMYGPEAAPMIQAFGETLNLPMVASLLAGYASLGSMGFAKLKEVMVRNKKEDLQS